MSYVKLALGAITAGLGAAYIALNDDKLTAAEYVQIAIAALVGTGLVVIDPRKTPPVRDI